MKWLVFIVVLTILLGPMRRHAFGKHITFTLPGIVGAGIGFMYGCWARAHGAPVPGLPLLCAVIGAFVLGGAAKRVLDDLFNRRKE